MNINLGMHRNTTSSITDSVVISEIESLTSPTRPKTLRGGAENPEASDSSTEEKKTKFSWNWITSIFSGGSNNETLYRPCSEDEKFVISSSKLYFKQLITTGIIAIVAWFFVVKLEEDSKIGELFNCDANDNDSIIAADEVAGDFKDGGESFCYFKSVMIIVSFIFLFPFALRTLSLVLILWVSIINEEVLIPVSEGFYAGQGQVYSALMSSNPLRRVFSTISGFRQIVVFLVTSTDGNCKKVIMVFEIVWKFFIFLLPDILLTFSLFPISYFVMHSSKSPDEVVVNLVAVQVFATLDEIFVKMLMRPREDVGETIQNYCEVNPKIERAMYRPLNAYLLVVNRHEMGIPVQGQNNGVMADLHNYSAFKI
eukprot:maker-scaffold_35-snap-gene-2.88-mRNA-1 protein AED:0.00 eAED:0.00 QI:168/1/1/1/0.66/0.5/4/295/368